MHVALPIEGLRERVFEQPRRRRSLSPTHSIGDVVVAGDPRSWAAAAEHVGASGGEVRAFWDTRWRVPRARFAGARVVHGALPRRYAAAQVVFAGTPHKRWFNGPPPGLERCAWHLPPQGNRRGPRPAADLLERHGRELGALYHRLHDEASRDVLASLVRGRIEGCCDYYAVSPYAEYAHPVVRARPGETVLDVGAYTGWSTLRFLTQVRGRGRVIALEPLPRAFARLARFRPAGVWAVDQGAWDRDQVLAMSDRGAGSRLGDSGTIEVRVRPLDDIVAELGLDRVDLIKLDIEGAEQRALEGARQVLGRFRPKLQISVYHRPGDLFELPAWIAARLPGYRYYLGHHNFYGTETDLYAIPLERLTGGP